MKCGQGQCKLCCVLASLSATLRKHTVLTALPCFGGSNAINDKEKLACVGRLGADAHES